MDGRFFCKALKEERLRRDYSLEEISARSNIPIKVLAALEGGDFSELPGRFYIRSFLRSYLKALGADEKDFFLKHRAEIDRLTREVDAQKMVSFSKLKYNRFRSNRFIYLVIGFVILVVLFFVLPQLSSIREQLGVPGLID